MILDKGSERIPRVGTGAPPRPGIVKGWGLTTPYLRVLTFLMAAHVGRRPHSRRVTKKYTPSKRRSWAVAAAHGVAQAGAHWVGQKLKARISRSHTNTRRNRRTNTTGSVTKSGTGSDKATVTLKKSPKGQKTQGRFTVNTVGYASAVNVAGVQGYTEIISSGNRSDWISGNPGQGVLPYFDLNPNERLTGSNTGVPGATNGLPVAVPTNDRIYLYGYEYECKLTNMESIATTISLYWYMTKEDTRYNLSDGWSRACTSTNNGSNFQTDPAPGVYQTGAIAGTSDPTQWGQTPYQMKDVRKQYRILKVQKFYMASGATEDVRFKLNVNRQVDKEYMTNLDTNTNFIRGVSVGCMAITHSQAVIDKTNSAHVGTLGSAEVAVVWKSRTKLGLLKSMTNRIDVNRQYTMVPFNTLLANQYTINENDQIQVTQQA